MSDEPEPQEKPTSKKQDWQIAVKWLNTSGFRTLIIAAGLLTIALILFVVLGISDPSTKANVFIAGILTILTIVVTTISAVSNRLMVEVMDRQETEMTNARITAQEQRDAMRDQHVTMIDALKRTDTLIEQNKSIIQSAQQQALASEKALKLTREHFELVERPALGIEGTAWIRRPEGDGWIVKSEIVNSGKTYARIVEQSFAVGTPEATPGMLSGEDITEPIGDEIQTSPIKEMFVHANGKLEFNHCFIPADEVGKIRETGEIMLILWMRLKYQGRSKRRTYTFTYFVGFDYKEKSFKACPTGNYAD